MTIPRFTAEAAFYWTSGQYWGGTSSYESRLNAATISSVYPAEIIEVEGHWNGDCGPGWSNIGGTCWPNPLTIPGRTGGGGGGGGIDGPSFEEPSGPSGPLDGFGGGREPASVPPNIVRACLLVGGRHGEKYCGGPRGPSCCKSCAQAACQQRKCKETGGCDPNQLNGAIEAHCDNCCNIPGCKDGLVKKAVVTGGGLERFPVPGHQAGTVS
jgi:hypothetical protein